MTLMRRWFQNVVSLILTCLCILKCFTNIETIPEIESSKACHRNISKYINFVSLKSEFSVIMNEKFKKQVFPETQMQKVSRGNVKGTSVSRTLHVKSPLIRHNCNSDTWLLPHTGKNTLQATDRDTIETRDLSGSFHQWSFRLHDTGCWRWVHQSGTSQTRLPARTLDSFWGECRCQLLHTD